MNKCGRDDDTCAKLLDNCEEIPAWMDVCESDQENGPEDSYHNVNTRYQAHRVGELLPIELVASMTNKVPIRIGLLYDRSTLSHDLMDAADSPSVSPGPTQCLCNQDVSRFWEALARGTNSTPAWKWQSSIPADAPSSFCAAEADPV